MSEEVVAVVVAAVAVAAAVAAAAVKSQEAAVEGVSPRRVRVKKKKVKRVRKEKDKGKGKGKEEAVAEDMVVTVAAEPEPDVTASGSEAPLVGIVGARGEVDPVVGDLDPAAEAVEPEAVPEGVHMQPEPAPLAGDSPRSAEVVKKVKVKKVKVKKVKVKKDKSKAKIKEEKKVKERRKAKTKTKAKDRVSEMEVAMVGAASGGGKRKKRQYRFDVELRIDSLNDVPLINATILVGWKVIGGSRSASGSTEPVRIDSYRVEYGEVFEFVTTLTSRDLSEPLNSQVLRLTVHQELKGGRQRKKLGLVDIDLAEAIGWSGALPGQPPRLRRFLLQECTSNSALALRLVFTQLTGSPDYVPRSSQASTSDLARSSSSLLLASVPSVDALASEARYPPLGAGLPARRPGELSADGVDSGIDSGGGSARSERARRLLARRNSELGHGSRGGSSGGGGGGGGGGGDGWPGAGAGGGHLRLPGGLPPHPRELNESLELMQSHNTGRLRLGRKTGSHSLLDTDRIVLSDHTSDVLGLPTLDAATIAQNMAIVAELFDDLGISLQSMADTLLAVPTTRRASLPSPGTPLSAVDDDLGDLSAGELEAFA
ncbi:SYM-3A protein [Thecamonas trahens ATCC 50062]|uniref:SYM-3A protein n=1 Tax=Thecamonas trahens ATCC 50062 TaxID=461836 RepID=A0A0L0DB82_THETB|nr:SYM-3A protein [Thecamonas trahens ATCC 50062]KNC49577.1 SYM-3A protein [Thecamonas trahens ATCC 50062]|eukprot:XP_013757686.1 SYM-3A protein [Thecamonas trahens ATCC 50062]